MPKQVVLIGPAMETLFARDKDSFWPPRVLDNPEMAAQAELRQKLLLKLNALFTQVPDAAMDIATALEVGAVKPCALAELYDLLTNFLDTDPHHRRLVLYFPFELLPREKELYGSDALSMSQARFVRSYLRCWRKLLEETDVRANFVDGNILEDELAPDGQPLVRKAAHLIPQLMQKGLVSISEIEALLHDTKSEILKQSIADAITPPASEKDSCKEKKLYDARWLKTLPDEIVCELEKLAMREAKDYSRGMPPARVAWERLNNESVLVSRYGEQVAEAITANHISYEAVLPFLSHDKKVIALSALHGLRLAVEQLAKTDRPKAACISKTLITSIQKYVTDISPLSDDLETVLAHWAHLGFADEADLRRFGFTLPKLDALFSNESQLAKELVGFTEVIRRIGKKPELRWLFYPVGIFFGSRLKGYAKRNADLDVAVFIKPGVSPDERKKVRAILAGLFPSDKIDGKIVEFWLEDTGRELAVRNFPNTEDVFLAESTWIHLLFQSVWLGEEEAVKELYEKLLPGFLFATGKTFLGHDIRKLRLDEIEREVLQYRLMHKGYRRFFPNTGGIDTHALGLDPESVFWDSGYRRLATKLFLSRIFLPQLVNEKDRSFDRAQDRSFDKAQDKENETNK